MHKSSTQIPTSHVGSQSEARSQNKQPSWITNHFCRISSSIVWVEKMCWQLSNVWNLGTAYNFRSRRPKILVTFEYWPSNLKGVPKWLDTMPMWSHKIQAVDHPNCHIIPFWLHIPMIFPSYLSVNAVNPILTKYYLWWFWVLFMIGFTTLKPPYNVPKLRSNHPFLSASFVPLGSRRPHRPAARRGVPTLTSR